MSEDPRKLAGRAASQAGHAAKNSGRAIEAAADEAITSVVEKIPTSYKAHVIQGFVLLGVSWVTAALSAKKLIDANKAKVIETARNEGLEVIYVPTRGRKVG